MTIEYFYDLGQNSDAWLKMRRGILTASNIMKILTPAKLEISKATGYLHTFCRQSLDEMPFGHFSTRHTDRGHIEESLALQVYEAKHGGLKRCGFVLNTLHGYKIGCSPDALIGDDGGVQVKSFTPDVQFGNIVEDKIHNDDMLQSQMELFVTQRKYWRMIYQSSGTEQMITDILPIDKYQVAIKAACDNFYERFAETMAKYRAKITDTARFTPTAYVAGLYDQVEEEITT